jgi:hypothetical protein
LYRFSPNSIYFRMPEKGERIKSVIRAPIANPGMIRGVDPYPPLTLFFGYFTDGDFRRGYLDPGVAAGTSSGQPLAASGRSPTGNRAPRGR